jgi:hypothetical protein
MTNAHRTVLSPMSCLQVRHDRFGFSVWFVSLFDKKEDHTYASPVTISVVCGTETDNAVESPHNPMLGGHLE